MADDVTLIDGLGEERVMETEDLAGVQMAILNPVLWQAEAVTDLAAGASLTGADRTMHATGTRGWRGTFGASFWAAGGGEGFIDGWNGTSWRQLKFTPVPDGSVAEGGAGVELHVSGFYAKYRARFKNTQGTTLDAADYDVQTRFAPALTVA